jgi:hypothetical protein
MHIGELRLLMQAVICGYEGGQVVTFKGSGSYLHIGEAALLCFCVCWLQGGRTPTG